ncbi:Ribosomal protein L3, bacterial/organelle-type [Candidatus Magnetobacterium bavaricum]|uniref:50S ribosomal protein L3 n=1 Tax=Candidatus Magnetobacterium bavaricum TaxID=29290 RepID=A0A0F3GLJ3_9BACT|nr:Ribosomal protein L3, bacterial/organelle-type [Candidatus Magnetobacterium bavaricum]
MTQVKTIERDGYAAVKMGFIEERKLSRVNKPMKGVFDKANQKPHKILKEFKMTGLKVGDLVTVDKFAPGEKVKVSGISKGKGFQGVMKRHNYAGGPAGHGSMFNRAPGSIGASSFPSRVWKNKGMPGHMGCERVSVRNVTIFDVRPDQNLLIVKGMVPGATGNIIEITRQN